MAFASELQDGDRLVNGSLFGGIQSQYNELTGKLVSDRYHTHTRARMHAHTCTHAQHNTRAYWCGHSLFGCDAVVKSRCWKQCVLRQTRNLFSKQWESGTSIWSLECSVTVKHLKRSMSLNLRRYFRSYFLKTWNVRLYSDADIWLLVCCWKVFTNKASLSDYQRTLASVFFRNTLPTPADISTVTR